MGKRNRFRALKDLELGRFKQIEKVRMYKQDPEGVVGEGLCAAAAMRWVATQKVPKTDTDLNELKEVQEAYDKKVETKSVGNAIEETLAPKYERRISSWRLPYGSVDKAIEYWHKKGGFAGGLTSYVRGELEKDTPRLPCYIWVNFAVTSLNDLSVDDALKRPEFKGASDPRGGHAMALLRTSDDGPYHFFDPNAGVYEVPHDMLEVFFQTLQRCYKSFYNLDAGWNEDFPDVAVKAEVDVEIVRIYHVLPK